MLEKLIFSVFNTLAPLFLFESSIFSVALRQLIISGISSNFDQLGLCTAEIAALCVEKLIFSVVNTISPSFLIGSFSIVQVTRATTVSLLSLHFDWVGP